MKYFTPLLVLAASTTISALAILPRDANTILADIEQIRQQTAMVQSDVDAFIGGPLSGLQALKIKADSDALDATLKKGANDARASAPFPETESANIANAVTGLQRGIFKVLDSLVAKKEGFRTAVVGFSAIGLVRDTLVTLRQDTAAFGNETTVKLTSEIRKVAPLVLSNIDFHFARAIDAFSN